MLEVERFKATDLKEIMEQPAMAYLGEFITDANRVEMEKGLWSYTVRVKGRALMCAGVTEYWPNRGEAWAIIDRDVKVEFLRIHRVVKRFLDVCPLRRIEATIDLDFKQGHRWVEMLGFKLEAPKMKAYRPDGRDASLYALVK